MGKKRNTNNEQRKVDKGYFSVSELADYSGISERSIWDFLKSTNPIPHFRIGEAGRIVRVRKSDFDQWVESYRVNNDLKIDMIVEEMIG